MIIVRIYLPGCTTGIYSYSPDSYLFYADEYFQTINTHSIAAFEEIRISNNILNDIISKCKKVKLNF